MSILSKEMAANNGLEKKLNKKYEVTNIHDLVNYKIIVSSLEDCYKVLG